MRRELGRICSHGFDVDRDAQFGLGNISRINRQGAFHFLESAFMFAVLLGADKFNGGVVAREFMIIRVQRESGKKDGS